MIDIRLITLEWRYSGWAEKRLGRIKRQIRHLSLNQENRVCPIIRSRNGCRKKVLAFLYINYFIFVAASFCLLNKLHKTKSERKEERIIIVRLDCRMDFASGFISKFDVSTKLLTFKLELCT